MKILIADDDLTIRSILQAMTKEWGFQPCLADDGNAAWASLQQDDPPHILLLDWEMPGLDGLQLCQKIRQQVTDNPPYIILLTARNQAEDIAEGLESGANDFVSKPFKKVELQARLKVAQRVIRLQQERLRSLADAQLAASVFTHALEGIIITDQQGIIIDVNRAYSDISGYSREESIHRHARHFFFADNQQAWQSIYQAKKWRGDIHSTRKNGEEFYIQLTISAVYNDNDEITHYIGLLSDITESELQKQQLEYAANHDGLTKLANRVLLKDRLAQAMARVRRDAKPLAVVYLDLDGFKAVNDKFGHDQGDALLVALAEKLQNLVRETDTVARIGGDEFIVLLTGLNQPSDCEPTLQRLLQACASHITVDGIETKVSASLGVSFFTENDTLGPDELFKQADTAMYAAKNSGKNCIKFYHEQLS
ncbi:MAG: diguanylate cyclase [Cycloclasticus sp.]